MESPKDVLAKLEALEFQALVGLTENEWLDAKETPYHLETAKQKLELAKDVTAFANAGGGIIVIGFACVKQPTTSHERISEVCEFPVSLVDPDKYRKILADLIHPAPHGVVVRIFERSSGKAVAAIVVDRGELIEKPYLVGKMLDESSISIGSYFGYFERKRDVIPQISLPRIQQLLSAGNQWHSINERLQAIELNIAAWGKDGPRSHVSKISSKARAERLAAARAAADLTKSPIVYYMASAEENCDFPTLFKSRSERIVQMIERPPQLREDGFGIWASDQSEIVEGRLRRNVLRGHRTIELWKDGCFIFVAPGDENFLGWRVSDYTRPIHISNFVLAESVLVFCWLMSFVFAEADPKPPVIHLAVGFDDLRRPSGLPTLSTAPEGPMRFQGETKTAPSETTEVFQSVETASYDPEQLAYLLLAKIFNWFGFNSAGVPYVDSSGSKPTLDSTAVVGRALPDTLPIS